MSDFKLYIGNKNYSSWSFRGWLALKLAKIKFEEILIPLFQDNSRTELTKISPSGKVPCLHHNGVIIWDSLAIIEYVNEITPIYPQDKKLRSIARSAICQMHSGFTNLRSQCPMSMRKNKAKDISEGTKQDLQEIYQLWDFCKKQSGNGDFLLGDFSAIDVFFAPVVSRILSYQLDKAGHEQYINKIVAHEYYQEWQNAALQEQWNIAKTDEV